MQVIGTVMLRDDPTGRKERMNVSLTRFRACMQAVARGAFVLACFGLQSLSASNPAAAGGLIVQRSARAVPHKFIVSPSGATVAANQTQHFGVTDAQGKPVAVHWNISGLGCSGMGCGTIDEQGVYHAPTSLQKPLIVTLEGVVAADPNYSVLTEVRLAPAVSVTMSQSSNQVAATKLQSAQLPAKIQPMAAPTVGAQALVSRAPLPSSPAVINAPPSIGRNSVTSNKQLPPLPNVVGAAPSVEKQSVGQNKSLPLPKPVAAAPMMASIDVSSRATIPAAVAVTSTPKPQIIAAPTIGQQAAVSRTGLPPVPSAVAAPPAVEKQLVAHNSGLPPLPGAVAAPPKVERPNVATRAELGPLLLSVGGPTTIRVGSGKSQTPAASLVTKPSVAPPTVAPKTELTPQPNLLGSAAPTGTVVSTQQGLTWERGPAHAATQPVSANSAPTNAVAGSHDRPVVTYRDGQLTIDAENLTLAAVLGLVAQKTGAAIDVPPGSGQERIFQHVGPGRAEDVLASLLNGSPFDFVIVGSPQMPHDLSQVLLSVHREDAAAAAPVQVARPFNPSLWTPPAEDPSAVIPIALDNGSLKPPSEQLSPEALGQLMKDRAQQLREQIASQLPPQQ
jgi:hypothetical protein